MNKGQWERLRGGCGGVWRHRSGWFVRHCGHPTALWPYYAVSPAGAQMLAANGRGFQKLAMAQDAVEVRVACRPEGG